MLLLDENQEVLTLVTNSLQKYIPIISLPVALADSTFPSATSITQTNTLLAWLFAPLEI